MTSFCLRWNLQAYSRFQFLKKVVILVDVPNFFFLLLKIWRSILCSWAIRLALYNIHLIAHYTIGFLSLLYPRCSKAHFLLDQIISPVEVKGRGGGIKTFNYIFWSFWKLWLAIKLYRFFGVFRLFNHMIIDYFWFR